MSSCSCATTHKSSTGSYTSWGGGWNHAPANKPFPVDIAILIAIPWTHTNETHPYTLTLIDDDGHPAPTTEKTIHLTGSFQIGRPPHTKPGTPQHHPIILQPGPLTGAPCALGWRVWAGGVGCVVARNILGICLLFGIVCGMLLVCGCGL